MYEIELYETSNGYSQIKEFIEMLSSGEDKDSRVNWKAFMFQLGMLEKLGFRADSKYVEHIDGPIWQLRPKRNRILMAGIAGNRIVLLHQFLKSTRKTPPSEIEQAKRELFDWIQRKE